MYYVGIDIGSTASKLAIFDDKGLMETKVYSTGWSSLETSRIIKEYIESLGIKEENSTVVATGYGRVSVPYADKTLTEITCHGTGATYLNGDACTVIDIGGQDTKVITIRDGSVVNFTMNDKCAAGTGRFLELMANTLGLTIMDMCKISQDGKNISISSMCTVFAESEVISLIGSGNKREDIASGVVDSIAAKVKSLCQKHSEAGNYFLTGGLCDNPYIISRLSTKLGSEVKSHPMGRYAGAIGAAILAKRIKKK